MTYVFSQRSLDNLEGVHPDLVSIAHKALELTPQDFTILEGLRSEERQRQLYNEGKSQTLNSRHLTGHAIDIAPYVNGDISWEWEYFYPVADAFRKAAQQLDIPLRWGGNWRVNDLRKWHGTAKLLHEKYPGDFPDGPHFELPRRYYA